MNTKEIIAKGDMALADFQGAGQGGLLLPEQANEFIRKLIIQPTIINQCRVVPMSNPQMNVNKIGFGSRIMRPAVSGQALAVTDRAKPTSSQIQLNTKEVIAQVNLPYDVIEDVIERGTPTFQGANSLPTQPPASSFKDTIVDMVIERAALDLEELALLGNTLNATDAYLALLDGYLIKANQHIVDYGGNPINKTLFKQGIKALPIQYQRALPLMKHLVATNQELEYRDTLANRETQQGDAMTQGIMPVYGFGVPVDKTPMMPVGQGLLTHPQNLLFGIQRKLSIEVDKDITARVFMIVITARIDVQIEEADACVQYQNIGYN